MHTDTAPAEQLLLSEPDVGELESALVQAALGGQRLSAGPMVQRFEQDLSLIHI